jgi:hypothetical protein
MHPEQNHKLEPKVYSTLVDDITNPTLKDGD